MINCIRHTELAVIAIAFLALPFIAHAQTSSVWYESSLISTAADSVGVGIYATYPKCPNTSVMADLWLVNQADGVNKFQNRCLLNTLSGTPTGLCYFKQPVPPGTSGNDVLINLWGINADCSTYAANTGIPGPKSSFLSQPVQSSKFYDAAAQNRLITIDKPTYTAKLDRATGATYEFYNKRAVGTSPQDPMPDNAIHANMGAALQIAFHDQSDAAAKSAAGVVSCGGQGYWNPTQAGAYCTHTNVVDSLFPAVPTGANVPKIMCDGVTDQNCTYASKSVSFGDHVMLNWDYNDSYPGPLNPADTLNLSQNVTAGDSFLEYDLTLKNQGKVRGGFVELPTFYFTNNYRRYFFQDPKLSASAPVTRIDIPRQGAIGSRYTVASHDEINWISFKNTSGPQNDDYTIAWFYDKNYKDDIVPFPGTTDGRKLTGYTVTTADVSGAIKFANYPVINLQSNKSYHVKYVIFPYRYDDVITSRFGTKSVTETITAMRVEFEAKNSPDPDVPSSCTLNWSCSSWSQCIASNQTRTCTDLNACGTTVGKPATSQQCTALTTATTPASSSTTPLSPQPTSENFAIAALQAQIQALLAQITALKGNAVAPATSLTSVTASCPNLTRNLSRGSRGNDVTRLQQFLISQNLIAPDSATGFFGALTEAAVKQWQTSNGVVISGTPATTGYGAVGPKTRIAISRCN
jgi:Putative peptidoglycan binding domain